MGFIDKITERTVRIENNNTFKSIKTAFVSLLPVFLTGAVTLALQNFPINAVREFINSVFNGFSIIFSTPSIPLLTVLPRFISL